MNHHVVAQNHAERRRGLSGTHRVDAARLGFFQDRALLAFGFALVIGLFGMNGTAKAEYLFRYEVTVTSLVRGVFTNESDICKKGQIMGLFAFATHRPDFRLFKLGKPASGELATLAESGAPFVLVDSLVANPKVRQAFSVPAISELPEGFFNGVLCPGEKIKTTIQAKPGDRFSMAAMIFPTNDGFIALNGVALPRYGRSVTHWSPVYDAGSEANDEDCANIPGVPGLPVCIGQLEDGNTPDPFAPDTGTLGGLGLGEGYVHIHNGIHGIQGGDLDPGLFDWRNPVARITIRHIK
jgi:Spondin_N